MLRPLRVANCNGNDQNYCRYFYRDYPLNPSAYAYGIRILRQGHSDGVDLEVTSSPATGNDLGWSAAGQLFNYTVNVSTAGTCTVTLQFAEIYWTAAGQRQFNVIINGNQVLTNFDIFANAGGENIAIAESFTTTANSSGQIVIQFTNGAADNAKISGIEVQ